MSRTQRLLAKLFVPTAPRESVSVSIATASRLTELGQTTIKKLVASGELHSRSLSRLHRILAAISHN